MIARLHFQARSPDGALATSGTGPRISLALNPGYGRPPWRVSCPTVAASIRGDFQLCTEFCRMAERETWTHPAAGYNSYFGIFISPYRVEPELPAVSRGGRQC